MINNLIKEGQDETPNLANQPPVESAAAPVESAAAPVTEENFLEHPNTPPHMLLEHTRKLISQGSSDKFNEVLNHENTPSDALEAIHSSLTSRHRSVKDVLAHKNCPASLATKVISDLSSKKKDNDLDQILHVATKHPGIDREDIKNIANEAIENPSIEWKDNPNDMPTAHLKDLEPEWLLSLLDDKAEPTSLENKLKNYRIYLTVLNGLKNTTKHTPANTESVINEFVDKSPDEHQLHATDVDNFIKNYVDTNPHINSTQLDKIFNQTKSTNGNCRPHNVQRSDNWVRLSVLDHPNVDPGLLAKIVLSDPMDYEKSSEAGPNRDEYTNNLLPNALLSPKLPEEVKKAFINKMCDLPLTPLENRHLGAYSNAVKALADYGNVTPEEVKKLHDAKWPVENSNKFPPSAIASMWDKERDLKSNAGLARSYLSLKNLPKSVIKDILGHKNVDVAIDALSHPNVDQDVIKHALKRRSKPFQDALLKHPLVPQEVVADAISKNKIPASRLLFQNQRTSNPTFHDHPETLKAIGNQYKGFSSDSISAIEGDSPEAPELYLKVKQHLANSEIASPEVRNENAKDIIKKYDEVKQQPTTNNKFNNSVRDACVNLARNGNMDAQDAVLKHEPLITALKHLDLGSDATIQKADQNLLSKVTDKIFNADEFLQNQNLTNPHWFTGQSVLNAIVSNPNISDELFERITLNPHFDYSYDKNYDVSTGQHSSPIDKKLVNKPPEHINNYFEKLLASNIDAGNSKLNRALMLAACTLAPLPVWEKNLQTAHDFIKDDLLHAVGNRPKVFLTGERFKNALMSKYTFPSADGPIFYLRNGALSQLNLNSDEDVKLLESFIDQQAKFKSEGAPEAAADWVKALDANTLYNASDETIQKIASRMISNPYYPMNDDIGTLSDLLIKKNQHEIRYLTFDAQLIRKQELTDKINKIFSINTQGPTDPEYIKRWKDFFVFHSFPTNFFKDTQKLGFLGETKDPELIARLVGINAAHPSVYESLPIQNAQTLRKVINSFRSTTNPSLRTIIQNTLNSTDLNGELLNVLTGQDPAVWFPPNTPRYRDNQYSPDFAAQGAQASENCLKLLDKILLHPFDDEKFNFAKGFFNSLQPDERGFRKNELSNLGNLMKAKLENLPDKFIASRLLLNLMESDLAPSGVNDLAKHAIKSNDIDLLLKILTSKSSKIKVTPFTQNKIASYLQSKFDSIFDVDVISMHSLLNRPNKVSFPLIQALVNQSIKRMETKGESALEPSYKSIKNSLLTNLIEGLLSSKDIDNDEAREKNSYLIDTLSKLSDDINRNTIVQNGHKNLFKIAHNDSSFSKETRKKAFLATSKDPEFANLADLSEIYCLSSDLVNDPEIVEHATSRLQIKALLPMAESFTPDTSKILINRIVDSDTSSLSLPLDDKLYFLHYCFRNSMTSDEDIVKLARSTATDHKPIIRVISDLWANERHDRAGRFHVFFDLMGEELNRLDSGEIGVLPGGQIMDIDHSEEITRNLARINNIVKNYPASGLMNQASMDAKVNNLVDKVIKTSNKLVDHWSSKNEDADKIKIQTHLIQSFNSLLSSKNYSGRIFIKSQAMDLLNTANKMFDFCEGMSDHGDKEDFQGALLAHWAQSCSPDADAWPEIFNARKEMIWAVASHKPLTLDIAKSFPIDELIKNFDKNSTNITDRLFREMPLETAENFLLPWLSKFESKAVSLLNSDTVNQNTSTFVRATNRIWVKAFNAIPEKINWDMLKSFKTRAEQGTHSYTDSLGLILPSGAGGRAALDDAIQVESTLEAGLQSKIDVARAIFGSPHLNENDAPFILSRLNNGTANALLANINAPSSCINSDYFSENTNTNKGVSVAWIQHPKLSKERFMAYYETHRPEYKISFEDFRRSWPSCFSNPNFGGEIFRKLPEALITPRSLIGYVDPFKIIDSAEYSAPRNKLRQVLSKIPAEGVSWADFKRANKSMENWTEVKKLFQNKTSGNQKVLPEDVARMMDQYPANRFHITYSIWNSGTQRHMGNIDNTSNLTVQLNTSKEIEDELKKDPKLYKFFNVVQKWAFTQSHPVNPHTVGWIRVDVSNAPVSGAWIVEEMQSDFHAKLRKAIQSTDNIDEQFIRDLGFHATTSQLLEYADKVDELIGNWRLAAFSGIEDLAKKQGIKTLYMHGPNISAINSNLSPSSPWPVRVNETYNKLPEQFGFEKCDYTDYPRHSQQLLESVRYIQDKRKDTFCWRKRLT